MTLITLIEEYSDGTRREALGSSGNYREDGRYGAERIYDNARTVAIRESAAGGRVYTGYVVRYGERFSGPVAYRVGFGAAIDETCRRLAR